MGLDNGIVYKSLHIFKLGVIKKFLPEDPIEFKHSESRIDICYWRKCWNVRRDILQILNRKPEICNTYTLSFSDITSIRKLMSSYLLRPSLWDEYSSFWSWAEMRRNIFNSYVALLWLERCVKKDIKMGRDFIVYFYDSY